MSERTLARRLAEEGTTFFRVTDGMKARIAQDHLVGDELPVSEIAALLGYRSASSFVHAVRRWTGRTPTDLRAEAVRLRTVAPDRPRRRRD
jgi:AraC-like DNA-binding protein